MDKTRWEQIEIIYHATLEQPPEERADFLSDKCAGDEELYKEIQSLLTSNEKEDNFLSEPEFNLGLRVLAKPHHVLKQNQKFGNYKIIDFLGRGGMGEVYLAEDSRLGRFIALKVLPADVASDEKRIQRFMQEARAASALNHPNILTIYDIGESDGWHFIASEFVEGETLRERLKREKCLSSQETIEIVQQIATALNAAHKSGIIHRDIKPENLMLREDGLIKVLDFGLAKLTENFRGSNSENNFSSTTPGMVMGTVAYMSPEQLRGQKTDARSDIWSFGVVLYEMLAGKLPFKGDTTSDMIAAILTSEPASSSDTQTEKPKNLRQILGKALCKNPAKRYQSVSEMADDLKNTRLDLNSFSETEFIHATAFKQIGETDSRTIVTSDTLLKRQTDIIPKSSGNKIIFAFASVLLLVLACGYAAYNYFNITSLFSREPIKITRVFDTGKTVAAAISPDGKYVAHAVADAGGQSIWIKHLATNSNVQLIPPKSADYPAMTFSNDGNYIYFGQGNGELHQTPVLGGESKKILDGVFSPISFSPDGQQFAFIRNLPSDETALMIANSDGSGERQIAIRKKPESFGYAAWSPDGKAIACVAGINPEEPVSSIVSIPVEGGSEKIISAQKWRAIWQPVWLTDASGLIASAIRESPNDPQQIWFFPASGGEARQVTNDLNNYGYVSLTADSNTLVTIRFEQRSNIWHLPRGKSEEARLVSNNVHALYRWIVSSPDGRIIYTSLEESSGGGRNLWIMNADGSGIKQLTANAGDNILPCATRDGRYIVFSSNRADQKTYQIWRINIDGTNPVQLTNGGRGARAPACSSDGKTIVYTEGGPDSTIKQSKLWKVSIDGGEPVQLTDYPSSWKDISPDGNLVAIRFLSEGAIKLGIITTTGKPVKVFDLKENTQIRWKPDGRSITYIKDSNIWEQPIDGGVPKQLTKFSDQAIYFFDWSKDGDLICTRGYQARDPVLISDFR